jgi:hypothetical protein
MSHVNIGRYQVLYWPRWKFWFYRPTTLSRDTALYRFIYQWIVYVWPIEVRKFR